MSAPQDRWSRRRAGVQAEAKADAHAVDAAIIADQQAALAEKTDDEILAELDLPDPDTMQAGDDFAAFMKAAVPERIRKRALRTLWLSNPVLANVDNLVDYGDDFTKGGTLGQAIKTTYQVGKGMLAHIEEMEKQQRDEQPVELAEDAPEIELVEVLEDVVEVEEPAPVPVTLIEEETPQDETAGFAVKRRMRFEFAS